VAEELLELIGLFDVVEDLLIVIESLSLLVQDAEELLGFVGVLVEPQHEFGDCGPLAIEGVPVAEEFGNDGRDLRDDVGPVLLGDVIERRVDVRIEEVLAQVVAEEFQDVEELGVDVPGVARQVGFLLEGSVLVFYFSFFVDHRQEVVLAEFQGRVEFIEPLVDVQSEGYGKGIWLQSRMVPRRS